MQPINFSRLNGVYPSFINLWRLSLSGWVVLIAGCASAAVLTVKVLSKKILCSIFYRS
jgi:hypothetical protein